MSGFRRLLRVFPLLLSVSLAFFFFSGCENKNEHTEMPENTKTEVRVGYIPVTHCIPLYVAIENGFFEKENLSISLRKMPGGATILEALVADELDIGFSNVVSLILAKSQGLPLWAFTGGPVEEPQNKDHAILVRENSKIDSITDLRGKKIALNTRRNIDHLMLWALLQKKGIPGGEVDFVEVPFPRMLPVLESDSVSAAASAEPFITVAERKGGFRILSWNYLEVRPKTFVSTYVTTEKFLSSHADAVGAFHRAIGQATRLMSVEPRVAREALAKYTSLDSDIANTVRLPHFEQDFDTENIEETISLMKTAGFLNVTVNISELYRKMK
jgi:NitT/TauT family transport system substrate-binding protein